MFAVFSKRHARNTLEKDKVFTILRRHEQWRKSSARRSPSFTAFCCLMMLLILSLISVTCADFGAVSAHLRVTLMTKSRWPSATLVWDCPPYPQRPIPSRQSSTPCCYPPTSSPVTGESSCRGPCAWRPRSLAYNKRDDHKPTERRNRNRSSSRTFRIKFVSRPTRVSEFRHWTRL